MRLRLSTVAARYDRSRGGRRLGRRLRTALLPVSPSTWRAAQVAAMTACGALLVSRGVGALTAMTLSTASVRGGSRLALRLLRRRLHRALEQAAPHVARLLAAELAAGCGPGTAVLQGARSAVGREGLAEVILDGAATRVELGAGAVDALAAAVLAARGERGDDALARVVTTFALAARSGDSGPAALRRLAAALDRRRQAADEASAALSEPRAVVAAVPVLALAVCAAVLALEPGASAAAMSPLGLIVIVPAMLVVLCGVALIRRVTATSAW